MTSQRAVLNLCFLRLLSHSALEFVLETLTEQQTMNFNARRLYTGGLHQLFRRFFEWELWGFSAAALKSGFNKQSESESLVPFTNPSSSIFSFQLTSTRVAFPPHKKGRDAHKRRASYPPPPPVQLCSLLGAGEIFPSPASRGQKTSELWVPLLPVNVPARVPDHLPPSLSLFQRGDVVIN